jgi:hypothetical protein
VPAALASFFHEPAVVVAAAAAALVHLTECLTSANTFSCSLGPNWNRGDVVEITMPVLATAGASGNVVNQAVVTDGNLTKKPEHPLTIAPAAAVSKLASVWRLLYAGSYDQQAHTPSAVNAVAVLAFLLAAALAALICRITTLDQLAIVCSLHVYCADG